MSNFFKSTKRLSLVMSALLLVITLSAGSFAFAVNGLPEKPLAGDVSGGGAPPEATTEEDPMPNFEDAVFEDEPDGGLELTTMAYNMPSSLKAVYLVPGVDFVKDKSPEADKVRAELDEAMKKAAELGMNTVVLDTTYNNDTIYETSGSISLFPSEDVMRYAVSAARTAGLFVYARFDTSLYPEPDRLAANAGEFAASYRLDGILIDGYETEAPAASYREYIRSGGSIGYDNYLLQASAEKVRTVTKAVHTAAPETAVGLLANAVWANKADNKAGSDTTAAYSSLINGHADTRFYIAHRFVDFLAVEAFTLSTDEAVPFDKTVGWWSDIAEAAGMPMYVVHAADKLGESGWPEDMMAQQAAEVSHLEAYSGSMFNTLSKMPSGKGTAPTAAVTPTPTPVPTPAPAPIRDLTPVPVSTAKPQLLEDEYPEEEPAEDGEYIDTIAGDASGSSAGSSSSASGSSELISKISPTGIIMALEDDMVDISVTAKKGAKVTARINGEDIPLSEGKSSGAYAEYTGSYDVPASDDYEASEYQYLGGLSVKASLNGRSQTFDGAFLAQTGIRTPVEVIAEQARTYPVGKKDNVPSPTNYPLPQGTIDYVVSDISEYTSSKGESFEFVTLESGVRVETKDIDETSRGPGANNKISGIAVSAAKNSRYTYVTLKTDEKVAYRFAYSSTGVKIKFMNTTRTPADKKLSANPLFTEAFWEDGDTLNLEFEKENGFMGYKAYYDANDNLVFRFKNPPKSIKGAKIAIDPGHGGKDRGGEGTDRRYPESVITHTMAATVAEELESRGANVLVLEADGIEGPARAALAEKWGADMLISLHCNTSAINPNASGTEAFYFYPYSYQLAAQAAKRVSSSYDVPNRGAKLSYYHVTLSPQFPSILLEAGFMTNAGDFNKLIKTANHKRIADGVADSVEASIKAAYTGSTAGGSESSGSIDSTSSYSDDGEEISTSSTSGSSSGNTSGGIALSKAGDPYQEESGYSVYQNVPVTLLILSENGEKVRNSDFKWKSSKTSVAQVDSKGVVTGRARGGTCTITAESDDYAFDWDISVNKDVLKVTSIDVKNASIYILKDGTKQIEYTVTPEAAKGLTIKWNSNKSGIASVDSNGLITGKKAGECTITGTCGSVKVKLDIYVVKDPIKVDEVYLDAATLEMRVGDKEPLNAEVSPDDNTDSSVTWKSSNEKVATVDSDGVVKALKEGTATITCTATSNRKAIGSCKITVY